MAQWVAFTSCPCLQWRTLLLSVLGPAVPHGGPRPAEFLSANLCSPRAAEEGHLPECAGGAWGPESPAFLTWVLTCTPFSLQASPPTSEPFHDSVGSVALLLSSNPVPHLPVHVCVTFSRLPGGVCFSLLFSRWLVFDKRRGWNARPAI